MKENEKKRVIYTGVFRDDFLSDHIVYHQPMIKIIPVNDYKELDRINQYDWLILTNRFAAIHLLDGLSERKRDLKTLHNLKIVAMGEIVSGYLKERGITVDYVVREEAINDLVDLLSKTNIKDKKVLIPGSPLSPQEIPDKLRQLGAIVDIVVVYQNVKPDNIERIDLDSIDEIYFLSPWGFNNFLEIYEYIPAHVKIRVQNSTTQDYILATPYKEQVVKNT